VECTYIRRRKKIKDKPASLNQTPINKVIVARRKLSQQENCVENKFAGCSKQFGRQRPIAGGAK
jgi:hypothetical protein